MIVKVDLFTNHLRLEAITRLETLGGKSFGALSKEFQQWLVRVSEERIILGLFLAFLRRSDADTSASVAPAAEERKADAILSLMLGNHRKMTILTWFWLILSFCPLGSLGWNDVAPWNALNFRRTLQSWMLRNQWCKTTPRHTVSRSEIATDLRPRRGNDVGIKLCRSALWDRQKRPALCSPELKPLQYLVIYDRLGVAEMYGNVTECDKMW